MNTLQLQILLTGYCLVMLVLVLIAVGLTIRQQVLTGRVMKEVRAQRRQLCQIIAQDESLKEALYEQPKEIAEGARYLKKAADDIRWQAANKDIVLSDQLDMLVKQYRVLMSMQTSKISPPPADADGANARRDTYRHDGPGGLQPSADHLAVRPRLAAGRPVLRSEVKQLLSTRPVRDMALPASGADVVTLADHLARYA